MGTDPEQLRREIEDTRRELTYDVDALNEKVNPGRVVERRVTRTRTAATGLKDRIMGSAHDKVSVVQDRMHSSSDGPGVGDRLASARDHAAGTGQDVAHQARAKAEGNPLAAGLIAFGVGWLVSSLLPASEKEQQAASRLTEAAKSAAEPLKEQAQQVANQIKDDMQPAAQQAVASVKDTATQAAQTVKEEGTSAAQGVKGDAQEHAQQARQDVQQR
ncbi:DUF3618 domain-containing protein [Vallicoccus soli]|uniref:DUF3618 domain-containing protein n=1 Tax=Vallicoccus soli TaxID=2339232 RepID=A0A3A3Z272_9ACTN|nr:DUF3618 domain-containing protein [Vallicoccus soli]RJK97544.1 DUF3618 domain-containing protein [Vallicoccus soli]